MANYYKHVMQLKGDPSQLPQLQDAINDKVAALIADHAVEPDSLEFNRPENLTVSFVTRRMRDDLPALVQSLIGPDNRFPDIWMDVEVTDLEEMNECIDFANEDLKQVIHFGTASDRWGKNGQFTETQKNVLEEVKTLLKAAEYAACHDKWHLHREQLELARDTLHDAFPICFSKPRSNQTSSNERAA